MHWSHVYALKTREHPWLIKKPPYENTTKLSIPSFEHTARLSIPSEPQGRRRGQPAGASLTPGDQKAENAWETHRGWGESWGCGAEPGGEEAERRPQADKAPLAPPFWCPLTPRRAGRTRRLGPAAPPPRPQQPRRPRPSPSSSRWMMLSMLSLSISAIASQRPGGALPRRSARGSAGPTPLLVLSRFLPFPAPRFPSLSLFPPPPPQHRASTEQNGRRPLSGLAWRTDPTSATRLVGNPL